MTLDAAERNFLPINIAVLTVSDTRTLQDDKSDISLLTELLSKMM